MDDVVRPNHQTLSGNHSRLQEFVEKIECDNYAVEVPMAPNPRPYGTCYWNVAAEVEESGGEVVTGRMLLHWPKMYLCAEHHAVWRKPDGNLTDVTAKSPSDSNRSFTMFAPDDREPLNLDKPPNIRSQYLLLNDDPRVENMILAYGEKHRAQGSYNSYLHSIGYQFKQLWDTARREQPEGQEDISLSQTQYEQIQNLAKTVIDAERKLGVAIKKVRTIS